MKFDLTDFLLWAGAGCIVAGVAMMHVPAAMITAGVLMIVFAYLIARERADNAPVE